MARIRAVLIAACLWLAAAGLCAQDAPGAATLIGPVAQAIDDYLTRCVPFGFAGSVLAVKDGAVILAKGYGVADRTTGAACTPATIFDLDQLAQPLTACAVLVLEQQKKLRTKDTLDVFLTGVPDDKKKIQLHHLLTHTSGLPPGIPGVGPKLASREELIQTALRVPLRDTPGSDFVVSQAGYALLAAIVEIVTEQPFEQALRELVLQPAGLTSTGFRQEKELPAERVARALMRPDEPLPEGAKITRLPAASGEDERELATEGWYSWGLRGAGGILGTVEDLWRFEQALRGDALLTKDSKKKLFTPALNSFAYGWYVQKSLRKTTSFERWGTTPSGFTAQCARFPDEDAYFVLLASTPGSLQVGYQGVRSLLFGGNVATPPATRPRSPETLAALAGEYESSNGARWRVTAVGSALLSEARTPQAFELQAGKLRGDQKRIVKLSTRMVAGLLESDFSQMHELDREMETSRFQGVESWWRDLVAHHGPLRRSTLLGLAPDASQTNHAVALLEFERGEELLDLWWGDELFLGLGTGPPFASRLRLVPDSDTSFVAYDIAGGRQLAAARFGEAGGLELELPGGKAALKRK